jgi:hypothetical protein
MTPNNLHIKEILLPHILTEDTANRHLTIHHRFRIFDKSNLQLYYSAHVALNVTAGNNICEHRSQSNSKITVI